MYHYPSLYTSRSRTLVTANISLYSIPVNANANDTRRTQLVQGVQEIKKTKQCHHPSHIHAGVVRPKGNSQWSLTAVKNGVTFLSVPRRAKHGADGKHNHRGTGHQPFGVGVVGVSYALPTTYKKHTWTQDAINVQWNLNTRSRTQQLKHIDFNHVIITRGVTATDALTSTCSFWVACGGPQFCWSSARNFRNLPRPSGKSQKKTKQHKFMKLMFSSVLW